MSITSGCVMRPSVVVSFAEADWLAALIADQGPNLLVQTTEAGLRSVVAQMIGLCNRDVHTCQIPGPMNLPTAAGRIVLADVARLTRDQQIQLFDWIGAESANHQLISVTSAPLLTAVEQGRFLEGLFYRMNVITFSAVLQMNDSGPTSEA
jgi:hypothetical protein